MLKLFRAKVNSPFSSARRSIGNPVLVRTGSLKHHSVFLSLRAGKIHPRAPMIFRQPMRSAKLVSTVRTLKRKKSFLPTLSAFHTLLAPFNGRRHRNRLYVSLQNTRTHSLHAHAKHLKLQTQKINLTPQQSLSKGETAID